MRLTNILFSLIAILCNTAISAYSQLIVLHGKVVNEKFEPIQYANVAIKNSSSGSVTNEQGQFLLTTDESKKDTLIVSFIGYTTVTLPIDERVKKEKEIKIILVESSTQLREVLVRSKKLLRKANEIVKSSIQKIEDSKNKNPFILKGHFRHSFEQDGTYRQLIEGAVSIYDYEASRELKINVDELRRSQDFRQAYDIQHLTKYQSKDTIDSNKMFEFDRSRGFLSLPYWYLSNFKVNPIEDQEDHYGNLNSRFINEHKFKLDSLSVFEDDLVYVIKILPSSKSKSYFKDGSNDIIPIGKMFIRTDDFAILRMEYQYILNPKKKSTEDFKIYYDVFGSGIVFKIIAQYKDFNGYQYLSYLQTTHYSTSKVMTDNGVRTKLKNKLERTLLVNKIIINSKDVNEYNLATKWNPQLYRGDFKYNEDFWKTYITLSETESQKKLREDLEKKISLDEQFKKNN